MRVIFALVVVSVNVRDSTNYLPPAARTPAFVKINHNADMSLSDSSSLSSPPSSDDEVEVKVMPKPIGLNKYFKPASKAEPTKEPSSPPLPKRPASPPHEYVLADNADIAVSATTYSVAFPLPEPILTALAQ